MFKIAGFEFSNKHKIKNLKSWENLQEAYSHLCGEPNLKKISYKLKEILHEICFKIEFLLKYLKKHKVVQFYHIDDLQTSVIFEFFTLTADDCDYYDIVDFDGNFTIVSKKLTDTLSLIP